MGRTVFNYYKFVGNNDITDKRERNTKIEGQKD